MDLTGEYRIPATTGRVWSALNDPETLKACIPGCAELTGRSDTQLVAKVGPISATLKGSVTLSDLDPPRAYTITGQGQGGAAGFAKGSARVTLLPEGAETVLRYEAKAEAPTDTAVPVVPGKTGTPH
ncbi:MAG: carbon monoxide dehydrogenase subunit G [Alphaproteobacteria bacterium]|nr:carbon monoxide dehydrogenase subunit G [Alphaproteobacteria bacterium]